MLLVNTPPMGWNSWNTFGFDISADLIKQTADAMVDTGLLQAGYNYLVIDDGWQAKTRDQNGLLVPDRTKFPGGLESVIDYVHAKGLKFGIYSCAGTLTCGSLPGSYQHEFEDAETFAKWGVDFLKYDNCNKPDGIDDHLLFRRMAMALRNSGRDILFSACSWGEYDTLKWARECGAHMWRSTQDIADNWVSISNIAMSQFQNTAYNGTYSFNDMDMLTVGMYGVGHTGLGGCNDGEYISHFAMWALMMSPLMIGCDVRNITATARDILMNKELIEINQDEECRPPHCWKISKDHDYYGIVKLLANGDYAFGLFNFTDNDCMKDNALNLKFWDIGLPYNCGYGFEIRDVINHKDMGVFKEFLTSNLRAHSCAVYRGRLVKK